MAISSQLKLELLPSRDYDVCELLSPAETRPRSRKKDSAI